MWIEIGRRTVTVANLDVTPLAGVWIEMLHLPQPAQYRIVTPLAGVWIEMDLITDRTQVDVGHSPRGSVD